MKQQDIAILILIFGIAGVASFFVVGKFIAPSNVKLEAETVKPITAEFQIPDNKYFNDQSYNPTVRIDIAPVTNPTPFTNETR